MVGIIDNLLVKTIPLQLNSPRFINPGSTLLVLRHSDVSLMLWMWRKGIMGVGMDWEWIWVARWWVACSLQRIWWWWTEMGEPQIATVPNRNRLVTKSIIPQMREEHDPDSKTFASPVRLRPAVVENGHSAGRSCSFYVCTSMTSMYFLSNMFQDVPTCSNMVCSGKSQFLMGKSTINGQFSMAMLVYQRV